MKTVRKNKTVRRLLAGLLALVMICPVASNLPSAKAAEATKVTIQSYVSGGAQDFAGRWLLVLQLSEKLAEEAGTTNGYNTAYNGLKVVVNDGTQDVEMDTVSAVAAEYGKGQLAVIMPYSYLPNYDTVNAGNYTVTIKTCTITSELASYEITEDCKLEFNKATGAWQKAAGSADTQDAIEMKLTGLGEYGTQDSLSRWLFRFSADAEIIGSAWTTAYSGLQIVISDGTTNTTVTDLEVYCDEYKGLAVILPYAKLPNYSELGSNKYKMTIKAGVITSSEGSYKITDDFTIAHTEGTSWKVEDGAANPGGEVTISATVTIGNDDRNLQGNTKDGFYFVVNPADPLAFDLQNWAISYSAISGGVFANDVLHANVRIKKITESLYYVPLTEQGITPGKDMKIKIDGVFGNSEQAVKYLPATFRYDGNGKWTLTGSVEEEPLTEQAYTVYDLYDMIQVSAIHVPDDSYFNLTDLKKTTNVGLKLHVKETSATEEAQDYGIGFSKATANNIWVPSGYQVKVSPTMGRILIVTDADTVCATTFLDEVKKAYDLEFGVINMNDRQGKLAARKVYVKVNDAEVLSYLDKNLNRELGTYVPVYATRGVNLEFESCSQKGYKLVEKTPTVYDLSKINGGIKGNDTKKAQCVMLGTTKKSTNMSVRMKVKWNTSFTTYDGERYDEMKFGLAKASTDTLWDAAATGWHIALRPEQVLISTGDEQIMANVGDKVPKKEFQLEIGTYDIGIYKNGKKTGDYGRMVFVKINGEEVCSWLDKDMKRSLGKNVLVYASESTSATLSSLTSTKYLIRKKNTVADLYDACGLSEIQLNKNNITKLGVLPKKTGVALKTKVTFNKKTDEFKLAISKTVPDNFWDAEASGWQFWFRPLSNQIFIGYGVSEPGAVIGYDFQGMKKNSFVLEIGERDVVYNTGAQYGREIYIRINNEEVLSWIDTDYTRKLGTYVTAWASQNANIKLTSLTTTGYVPVDAVAKVHDFFDVGQYASVKLVQNECIKLGVLDGSKNQAVKMKVDLTKETDEFKIALGKISEETIWDAEASGWQFWLKPASNQIFVGYGVSEYAEMRGFEFPEHFTLEIGTRNVKMKNGKQYGLRIYMKIDGEEVLSWIDQKTDRNVGKNIIAYGSANADVTLTSLYGVKTLPLVYRVNGKEKSSYKLAEAEATVVSGKDSRIQVTIKKDPGLALKLNGIFKNEEQLKEVGQQKNVYTYLVTKPKEQDQIVVDLTTKKLRVDTAELFDIYEVSKQEAVTVKASQEGNIGHVIQGNRPGGINTAMRFWLDTPEGGFNQIRVSYLGDNAGLWSTSGFIANLVNQKAIIQLSIDQSNLAEGNCELIQPGKSFVVEIGAVKCYEEDVYKYDRWYIKIGKSADELELVVWFDSTQRGGYGSAVMAYGTDIEGCDFTLRSLKDIKTITDVSDKSETKKLKTTDMLGEIGYGVYYPKTVAENEKASIKIYTQEGMKLKSLKVNGSLVKPKTTADGGYVYDISSVTSNIKFSYTVGKE